MITEQLKLIAVTIFEARCVDRNVSERTFELAFFGPPEKTVSQTRRTQEALGELKYSFSGVIFTSVL
jgi:hypothetical protein